MVLHVSKLNQIKRRPFIGLRNYLILSVRIDIRVALARCYANGDGCEQNWIQNDKLNNWLKRRFLNHILKGSNNIF